MADTFLESQATNLGARRDSVMSSELSLSELANFIKERRLVEPALLLLEMHRPFGAVLHSLALFGVPLLLPILGAHYYKRITQVLEDPKAIEQLIYLLEPTQDLNPHSAAKPEPKEPLADGP